MKSLSFLFSLCFLFSLSSFGQVYEKLKESEVNSQKVEIARNFAVNYLIAQRNGSYYQFKDEATDALKNQLTEEHQRAGTQQVKEHFGDYKSMEYADTWIQKSNPGYKIYRFKGDFTKSEKKLAILVVLDQSDKIAGFWIRPWTDAIL